MPSTSEAPTVPLPTTKVEHLNTIFNQTTQLVGSVMMYMKAWDHSDTPAGLLEFFEDVFTSLPFNVTSIQPCSTILLNKILKRFEDSPITVVECINPGAPMPEPAVMVSADGTSKTVEQVHIHASNLPPVNDQPYAFHIQQPGKRFIKRTHHVAFIPDASTTTGGPVPVRAHGGVVQDKMKSRSVGIKKTSETLSQSVKVDPTLIPLPTSPITSEIVATTGESLCLERQKIPAHRERRYSQSTSPSPAQGHQRSKPKKNTATDLKPKAVNTAGNSKHAASLPTNSIPFPSSDRLPSILPDLQRAAPHVPHTFVPPRNRPASSVFSGNDTPTIPFNHFPPHPHANDGKAAPGAKIGLQRSHGFYHKSHPEIFWDKDNWNERPAPGQHVSVEDTLPPWNGGSKSASGKEAPTQPQRSSRLSSLKANDKPQKDVVMKKAKPSRNTGVAGPYASTSASDSSSDPFSSEAPSVWKGKKRAREEDEDDTLAPPAQRPRSEQVNHTGLESNHLRRSHRFRTMKKAVRAIAAVLGNDSR